ncbi:unnamed protein product [Oncorhynchus mykiss]|uniref:Uncharacterized protein n=1 Tax=Oncorhynchus mykiss TaxID=8022 RepID=A0A060YC88_ONCMY|nr:unnamed protein product [Oncorhynchus mykiss]
MFRAAVRLSVSGARSLTRPQLGLTVFSGLLFSLGCCCLSGNLVLRLCLV